MRAVTATAIIDEKHQLTMQVPADLPPGEHQVVVVIEAAGSRPQGRLSLADWPAHDVGPWPQDLSLRREDLYGDDGR